MADSIDPLYSSLSQKVQFTRTVLYINFPHTQHSAAGSNILTFHSAGTKYALCVCSAVFY